MIRHIRTGLAAGCIGLALMAVGEAWAQSTSGWWSVDAGGTWSTPGNWTTDPAGGYPDGAGASARLTNNITTNRTVTLDTSVTLGSLTIGDPAGADNQWPYTLTNTPGATITLDTGGTGPATITKGISGGTTRATDTMYPDIILNTNLLLTVNTGLTGGTFFNFNMYSAISGAGRTVTISGNDAGSGLILYNTNSSYSGRTIVTGNVFVTFYSIANVGGGNSSLGTPATVENGTIQFGRGAEQCSLNYAGAAAATTDRIIDMVGANGATRQLNVTTGAGRLTFTSPFTYSGGEYSATQDFNTSSGAGTLVVLGAITNRGVAVRFGTIVSTTGGTVFLLGVNTYTNATAIRRGTLVVNSIANADGTPSSLGAPTDITRGTIQWAPTGSSATELKYIGTGHSSDRVLSIGAGTGNRTLNASGFGKLTLIGNVTNTVAQTVPLVLDGAGEGELSGVIHEYASTNKTSLTKTGAGTWTLKGNNPFSGQVRISAGTLVITNANALGTASVLEHNGGALAADTFPVTISKVVSNTVTTTGYTGATNITITDKILNNQTGPVLVNTLASGALLTLGDLDITTSGGARILTLQGTGDTLINGVIANGGPGTNAIYFASRGTVKLQGVNTYGGTTYFYGGGTLVLDYTAGDTGRLPDIPFFIASATAGGGGGNIILKGGGYTEVVSQTSMEQGNSGGHYNILRDGGLSILRMNTLLRGGSARYVSINFGEDSIAQTDTVNLNGLLASQNATSTNSWVYATVGGADWAYNSTGGDDGPVMALSAGSYTPLVLGGGGATTNYILTGGAVLTGNVTGSTLKLTNSAASDSLTNGAYALTIRGLLYAGGYDDNYTITGTNNMMDGSGTSERFIYVKAGNLTMDAPVGYSGGATFMKSGPGRLILNKANLYTGAMFINEGVLRVGNNAALGTTAGQTYVCASPAGSALELTNNISIPGEALALTGNGISNGGGLRNVSGDNTYGGVITIGLNGARINSDAGMLSLTNGIVTAALKDVTFGGAGNITVSTVAISGAGSVIKDGSGTCELAANNTYSGSTTVNAGTLKVTGSLAAGNPANGIWVTVNSGGTLSGSGRCGEVRVKSGGTIKPEGGNLTVSNLVLYAGCTVYRDAGTTNRIVVSQAGSIADQQGLTIIGGSVTLGGTVAAGVYPLIEYSGALNGSVTNLSVANPEAGATYSFAATSNLVEVTVQKSAGSRLSVF